MRSLVWRRIKLVALTLVAMVSLAAGYAAPIGPAAALAFGALLLAAYVGGELALGPASETLADLHRRWQRAAIFGDIRRGQPFEFEGRIWHHADSPLWQPLPPATPNPQPTKEGDSWNSN